MRADEAGRVEWSEGGFFLREQRKENIRSRLRDIRARGIGH